MRSYWFRILMGALAIFAIGMVGITMIRRGTDTVAEVVKGSGPLNIPLAFVPFQLDGSKLGTIQHLMINREAPKKLSSIHVEVKLEDSLVAQGLAGCRLAANLDSDSSSSGATSTSTSGAWERMRSSSAPGTIRPWCRSVR